MLVCWTAVADNGFFLKMNPGRPVDFRSARILCKPSSMAETLSSVMEAPW